MTQRERFNECVRLQMKYCESLLCDKAKEYANGSVFHNFEKAGELQNVTPQQALIGMMAKHTISVYDLARLDCKDIDMWTEKITDSINYLLILMAMVEMECEEWIVENTKTNA